MKKIVLFLIISLALAGGKTQAQSVESIYPQYNELIGSYTGYPYSGSIFNNNTVLRFKVNSTIEFNLSSASFWSGCTNFTWYLNLPGSVSVVYGKNQRVKFTNTGYAVISIDALDGDGYRHRKCSVTIEVTN